jgi:hypothetical protein
MPMYRRQGNEERKDGAVAISTLFEKYKTRLRPPQGIVINTFCAVVASELGITLAPAAVRYNVHSHTLFVTTSGAQKTEILLNKGRLLALCRELLGKNGTPEQIV